MKRRRHSPTQIVRKLREAERLQADGADIARVASLESGETRIGSLVFAVTCSWHRRWEI
jgi:hypothetical protein